MDIKRVMTDVLEDLVDKELKQFIWQLCNGVTAGIEPIPRAKLQTSDREDVVDCMVKQYPDDAGRIAVQALCNMKQNELAKRLELKLHEVSSVQQPVQEEVRNSPESMQPIQSDWLRAYSITACSQQFKHRLLTQERNDVYMPTSSSWRKGSALLINNIKFDRSELNRPGAELDEENMEWLLRALGYSVEKHTNLSGDAINRAVKNFSKRYEHQNSDSTFVVIMSHGDRFDNKDAILGVHYQRKNPSDYFFVENIFSHLNSVNCPALIDKPKVILIHACRGGDDGGVYVSDSAFESDSWVHKEKDFVCFMSSLPEIKAYRNPHNGSYFFNYIVDVFSTSAHKYDIMELFRRIASRMENDPRFTHKKKLLPCIERMTLVKKFYLFPGL
ncbi:caspase-1-A-like isoform X1 [Sinocyclocheilus anshuiensis]|uniref:caspase-1-A-like isoform X1 n=1 Tax=Sinocyclocheilus anshuiensis TaxID=1608454 RepID=UPI0007B9EE53|nr:PREDICTED: caspase-1-A-like isoform X1 [Sinocyclocheilus anshuiensis]